MTATAPQQQAAPDPNAPTQQGPGLDPQKAREREWWIQTKHEYEVALARATSIWTAAHPPETLNAIAATLLIHFNRLRENYERQQAEQRRSQGHQQRPGAPQKAKPPAGGYTGPVPSCPWCQSAMYDNRRSKKSPGMPDFRCKQEQGACLDDQGRVHGVWIKGGKLQLPDIEQEEYQ